MSRLPAFLNQKPPLEHNVFGNLENPLAKHGPDFIREPVIELRAAIGFTTNSMPKRISARVTALM